MKFVFYVCLLILQTQYAHANPATVTCENKNFKFEAVTVLSGAKSEPGYYNPIISEYSISEGERKIYLGRLWRGDELLIRETGRPHLYYFNFHADYNCELNIEVTTPDFWQPVPGEWAAEARLRLRRPMNKDIDENLKCKIRI